MPRRNLWILMVALAVSLACHQKAHGRYAALLDTVAQALGTIDEQYVTEVDHQRLFEGAMQGLTSSLDEHSTFLSARQFRGLSEAIDQQFGGIGIEVVLDPATRRLAVLTPLVGTPAAAAGIRPGDVLLEINGRDTAGLSMDDAVDLLHGPTGETIRLALGRGPKLEPIRVELQRAIIKTDSVTGDSRDSQGKWNFLLAGEERIGYVRIRQFGRQTTSEVEQALDRLTERSMRGLVFDLRGNPGGRFEDAVAVCDLFVDAGRIVSMRGRHGRVLEVHDATPDARPDGFPIVVIVDRLSASAAEIVAACLQDHHRAIITGERTWGKGSVQTVFPLQDERSALKLTIATYWRPNGKNIHRMPDAKETDEWGVRPDPGCEIKLTDEQMRDLLIERQKRSALYPPGSTPEVTPPLKDPQLEKALDCLHGRLEGDPHLATG